MSHIFCNQIRKHIGDFPQVELDVTESLYFVIKKVIYDLDLLVVPYFNYFPNIKSILRREHYCVLMRNHV